MRALFFFSIFLLSWTAVAQEAASLPLTTARELRALDPAEAALKRPIRIVAVVTLVEKSRTVFVRDATGATFIRWNKNLPELHAGQQVEIVGESYEGLYLTGISARSVTVLGEGQLPPPLPVDFEQLRSGQFHYERVEARGIVRTARREPNHTLVVLALGDGRLDLHLPEGEAAEPLVDAEIRVVGLAAGAINERRQLVAPQLRVRSLADCRVVVPAPAEAFTTPTPVAELLRFAPGGRAGHRVTVRGVVTHLEPGANLWLRDGTQGLRLHITAGESAIPGDIVEAAGFPAMGTLSAELEDATWRSTGERTEIAPTRVRGRDLLSGRYDGDLVELEADVRDTVRDADRLTLTVQAGDLVFSARLNSAPGDFPAPGSRVRLTGICRVTETTAPTQSYSAQVRSVELLLRNSAGDLALLRRPPWWTAQRLAIVAGFSLLVAMLAAAWLVLLRRRVATQTAIIGEQLKAEAAAEERERIAREFHDTLEQELVGLALRLDAATAKVTEPKPRELLETAGRLVHRIQAEAHGLVRNLRARVLDDALLPEAIRAAVETLRQDRVIEVTVDGEPRRLPGLIEHELLRVAQEATTNAVKHGAATRIDIAVIFRAAEIAVRITDNGCGFDVERDAVKPGHFGLLGIRERAQKLGGHFSLRSQPSAGTTLEVSVPTV